ncbi:MAG: hypothetical protein ACK5MP_14450 [Nostocoides sp.]
MSWPRRGVGHELPVEVRAELGARAGRVLAVGRDERAEGGWMIVGRTALALTTAYGGDLRLRPWHDVDGGSWDHETFTLTVTWVDDEPPWLVVLRGDSPTPEAFRERVQASVVLADQVDIGPRRRARVVVRRDLATGELIGQIVMGRDSSTTDTELITAASAALSGLKEQVGMA